MQKSDLIIIGSSIILTVVCIKYKPAYKVTINGDTIAYVSDKDVLEAHLNKFLSNEKVREEFSRNFNLPPTTLDDPYIIQAIQNGMAWNDEFKDIRDWILSWMWTSIGWELISLSIDLQSYIASNISYKKSIFSIFVKFLISFWIFSKNNKVVLWNISNLSIILNI